MPTRAPSGRPARPSEAVADEGVAGVLTLQDDRQVQPVGKVHRHVLHGVHGDVRGPVQHALFQLLDEQALAADLRQGGVEDLVAARGHAADLDD